MRPLAITTCTNFKNKVVGIMFTLSIDPYNDEKRDEAENNKVKLEEIG